MQVTMTPLCTLEPFSLDSFVSCTPASIQVSGLPRAFAGKIQVSMRWAVACGGKYVGMFTRGWRGGKGKIIGLRM